MIDSATGLLEAQFQARGIALIRETGAPLPNVSANLYSLEEVLIDLLVNARDATEDRMASDTPPESPSLTIRTHEETAQVILEVADEECGIPENIKPKIFDPFFTTKDPDRGTGLGLAVCKSLVEQFGGTIAIRSQPEHGITVTVSLPSDQNPSD